MFTQAQTAFGEPAHCQRVNLVFLAVNPLRQTFWRVIQLYRYYCLYDQRSAVEFLGHEVHAAAMLLVTRLESALMGVQAFVLGQQRRMDV
ncbi:hypothetical protein D3C79_998460 [compost metagenome]